MKTALTLSLNITLLTLSSAFTELAGATVQARQSAPEANPGETWVNSLGMEFVSVPDTSVLFCIWETRVKDFAAFVEATKPELTEGMWSLDVEARMWTQSGATWRSPGFDQEPDHPVVGVNWHDAKAFCRWLTAHERATGAVSGDHEYRLPTSAEWSAAVGSATYPWGEQWPPPVGAGNYYGEENPGPAKHVIAGFFDGAVRTAKVGSYAPNRYGLYDLGGSVWEWCEDWYRKEMNTVETRQENPDLGDDGDGSTFRVLRGGCWDRGQGRRVFLQSSLCARAAPDRRDARGGFRVVLAATDLLSTTTKR